MTYTNHVEEQYFTWLKSQVSPAQMSELPQIYKEIEDFCLDRWIIRTKLFELRNLTEIGKVVKTVESNRVFLFMYKKTLGKMRDAMHHFYKFMQLHPDLLQEKTTVKSQMEVPAEKDDEISELNEMMKSSLPKKVENMSLETEAKESILSVETEFRIDFSDIQSLAFTKPARFSYFGKIQKEITSWRELYVQVILLMLDDYPHILMPYIECCIREEKNNDFSDGENQKLLLAPKKIKENIYLETNLSATSIAEKIGKLMDLCNVDYENLTVCYCKREKPEVVSCALPKETLPIKNEDVNYSKQKFLDWMEQNGFAVATIRSYSSAIGQSSKFAQRYGVCSTDLFLIQNPVELKRVFADLLTIPEFAEMNTRQHNRFRAAVALLATYCSDSGIEKKASVDPPVTNPLIRGSEPSKTLLDIPNEIRLHYAQILSERFGEDGYQPGRAIFYGRFRRFYAEQFGCDPSESDEEIDEIMNMVGTRREDRIYPKQDDLENGLLSEMIEAILSVFQLGFSAVYLEAIYERFQKRLADDLHIYSQQTMVSFLLAHAEGRFFRYHSYLTNTGDMADPQGDLLEIMKRFHQPQSCNAIHEEVWFIPLDKIKQLLINIPAVVNVGPGSYFYAPNLPVSTEELDQISRRIRAELQICSHITDSGLIRLISAACPDIAAGVEEYTTYGLRNCMRYLLRDQFTFNGPIITLKGKELNAADVFSEFAREHERLSVDELASLSEEMNLTIYWEPVLKEMVRVSEIELVRKDQIAFDLDAVDKVLEELCPEEYLPIPEVKFFLRFPNVGYPWNSYLLESYLFGQSKKFRLLHNVFTKTGVYGAMVRVESEIQDYRALLVDVLSRSDALSSTRSALQYIVQQGYQQRKSYKDIDAVLHEARRLKEQREKEKK